MTKKKTAAVYPPTPPKRPEREEAKPWPSPTPLPSFPRQDIGHILKQILDRLDAIEKRLENIENILTKDKRATS